MGSQIFSSFLSIVFLLVVSVSVSISSATLHSKLLLPNFIQCLSVHFPSPIPVSQIVFTPKNSSYESILESTAHNPRFTTPDTPKPLLIVTPLLDIHVQATVICAKKHTLQIKTRSGGHDFEGLSYTSVIPSFILLDLGKMKSIRINTEDSNAWVQAGANNGEIYFQLAQLTNTSGFPAGTFPSVGFGGLLSGGGIGTLLRKYGLSADNILDARIVDVDGRILDKESMGQDLFWAIRGGGASSFCVILEYKIRLVPVPPVVTVFNLPITLEQGASELFNKWQNMAYKMTDDVFFRVLIQNVPGTYQGNRTIRFQFRVVYLGRTDALLKIMQDGFPELGVQRKDCLEMTFVESVLVFANFPLGTPIRTLLVKDALPDTIIKSKSDFFTKPIPKVGLDGLWQRCFEDQEILIVADAWGGKMDQISESELPFPHRKGVMFDLLYFVFWNDKNTKNLERHLDWIRRLYKHMALFAPNSPRPAYVNSIDLDLGRNRMGRKTSYSHAKVWGKKYFKKNFKRLALVKGKVDPTNFFMHEQSIPPRFD